MIGCFVFLHGDWLPARLPLGCQAVIEVSPYSAILELLDKNDDFRAGHKLLNTDRIMWISQRSAEI